MFGRKYGSIMREFEQTKALLETKRAEKDALKAENDELKEEIERLNKLLAEQSAENFGAFIDEFVNGPADDRTEVHPWAMSR